MKGGNEGRTGRHTKVAAEAAPSSQSQWPVHRVSTVSVRTAMYSPPYIARCGQPAQPSPRHLPSSDAENASDRHPGGTLLVFPHLDLVTSHFQLGGRAEGACCRRRLHHLFRVLGALLVAPAAHARAQAAASMSETCQRRKCTRLLHQHPLV